MRSSPLGWLQSERRNDFCKGSEISLKEEGTAAFTRRFIDLYLCDFVIPRILGVRSARCHGGAKGAAVPMPHGLAHRHLIK